MKPSTVTDSDKTQVSGASLDLDELLASFSSKKTAAAGDRKEQRKEPRYRVKWHVAIGIEGKGTLQGYINDISTKCASVYLNSSLHAQNCTLHIYAPPLDLTNSPSVMEVSGRIAYVVYDGEKQLFRAAINFSGFNPESDQAQLGERLTKHHSKIPEFC